MQKITPHLWFNTEAKEATAFYTTLFPDSAIKKINTITGTPSGDCDIVDFKLAGLNFAAISAGPYFKLNPAVSFFVVFDNEADIKAVWDKLSTGGTVLMGYDTYPWAKKYGWLQDKYGLSWQLSWSDGDAPVQKITPFLMFTQKMAGKAKEAIAYYTSIFPDSKTDLLATYTKDDGDTEGFIKHGRFTLAGQGFMALDSSLGHEFTFNEALSFVINCETQEEIDHYWEKLSAVPESEQCGWIKDKFGVSWQIVPTSMGKLMAGDDKERLNRVTQAFLKMKKFDIKKLEEAYNQ
jgi:predicted 3-demethylubiquinone-9 3-methyltransferase (glyoxalase superfamily)